MSRSFKVMPNGDLQFPKRGQPPPMMENYDRDPGDPYLFHPSFIPCQYRTRESITLPCGKIQCNWFCKYKAIIVTAPICNSCEVEPKEEI